MTERLKNVGKNALLAGLSVLVVFGATLAADRMVGRLAPTYIPLGQLDLLFPPGSRQAFKTPEFAYTVEINSYGLRDREIPIERSGKYRILAIGDSYTYGWGVPLEETWVKRLEANVVARGLDAEVLNLGRPGTGAPQYALLAEHAVPILKPDLVLVAVLHNDLAQSAAERIGREDPERTPWAGRLYPNLARLLGIRLAGSERPVAVAREPMNLTVEDNTRMAIEAARFNLEQFTPEQRARFERLDETVKNAYLTGNLNPFMLVAGITSSAFYTSVLDLQGPGLEHAIASLAACLRRIGEVAKTHGARTLVAIVPAGPYVNAHQYANARRLGFDVAAPMLTAEAPDRITLRAAERAGLPCVRVTAGFRDHRDDPGLYFPLDNHFSPAGHRLYADLLTPLVAEAIVEEASSLFHRPIEDRPGAQPITP